MIFIVQYPPTTCNGILIASCLKVWGVNYDVIIIMRLYLSIHCSVQLEPIINFEAAGMWSRCFQRMSLKLTCCYRCVCEYSLVLVAS